MAALPYMQLYVADYLADTIHLDAEDHGAYLLIIMNYWQTGKPVPVSRLQKIARVSNDRWTVVKATLSEFFNDNGTEWVHERVERDLRDVMSAQTQRVAAGKASAEARKRVRRASDKEALQPPVNENPTTVQRPFNEVDTDKDTDKDNNNAPVKPVRHLSPSKPHDVDDQVWRDWLQLRKLKKAAVSQTVMDGAIRESAKAGLSLNDFLKIWCERGSQGLEAAWLKPSEQKGKKVPHAETWVGADYGQGGLM